jgi:hypothetical protein
VWRRVDRRAATVALLLGLVVAAASPWLLKNALLLGDPLHPFLRGPRLEPWIARIYGGATLPPELDPAALAAVWRLQAPFNFVDFFTAPGRIAVEPEGAFYHPNWLLLLLPLWGLFWRNAVLAWLAGPALAYATLVVLLQPATSLRYLIPALTPLTLVALHSYVSSVDKLMSARAVRFLLWATALAVLAPTIDLMYRQARYGRQLAYALGSLSRDAFLEERAGRYAEVVSFVNEQLPTTSRVLLLFEARGYYFRVPVLQDNGLVNWPLLAPRAAPPDCLRSAGVTHVLLNIGAMHSYGRRGLDSKPFRLDALKRFARDCLDPVYDNGGYAVFRVRGAAAGGVP